MGASLGSFGVVGFTRVRPGGLRFIRGHRVHWGALLGLSGSSGVARVIGVRAGGCQVHPCSLWCALGVVGFISGSWFRLGAPCESLGSSCVAGYIGVRPGDRQVPSWSLGSFSNALGFYGFIRGPWVHWGTP